MSRGQRLLLLIGLPVLAWVLHVTLCEWDHRRNTGDLTRAIITVAHAQDPAAFPGFQQRSGLFAATGTDRDVAIFAGIAAPLVMIGAAAYLGLGWRAAGRAARGLCRSCGYDLHAAEADRCPECGWIRKRG